MWFGFLLWWSLPAAPEVPVLCRPPPQTAFPANSIVSMNLKVSGMEVVPVKAASGLGGLFSCWGLGVLLPLWF